MVFFVKKSLIILIKKHHGSDREKKKKCGTVGEYSTQHKTVHKEEAVFLIRSSNRRLNLVRACPDRLKGDPDRLKDDLGKPAPNQIVY